MKYLGISGGRLVEEFVPLPSCGVRWMTLKDGTYVDVMFSLFFWYFTIGQIKKKLKEEGYNND